jgi:hypothetical protein
MKPRAYLSLAAALVLALPARAAPTEATITIDVRTTALVPGSSEGVTKAIRIPSTCTYLRHGLEVLERLPPEPVEHGPDAATSYSAQLRRAPGGRIDAVALTVVASVPPSLEPSAIGVRLSVVVRCE